MAGIFTVAFQGLMMFHQRASGDRHAAIVDAGDAHHHARIQIIGKPAVDINYGAQIRFDGAPRQPLTTDQLYGRHVPYLRDFVILGDIDATIDAKTPKHGGASAFVDLPGGKMTIFENFSEVIRLTKNARGTAFSDVLFARYVVLHAPYNPGISLVINSEPPQALAEGDIVIVTNTSVHSGGSHFPLYRRLLDAQGQVGQSTIIDSSSVSESSPDTPVAVKIALLQHTIGTPHFHVPNGDCGPTGNP
ncbi:MAG TPA: hypothetical protein VJZ00_13160 [Thermoanaerobaculia bacterium]|nr:hypothetical protein [Thermoanaerobaculia bacterium]